MGTLSGLTKSTEHPSRPGSMLSGLLLALQMRKRVHGGLSTEDSNLERSHVPLPS